MTALPPRGERAPEDRAPSARPLAIGSLALSSPFLCAPMAGVSDLPFRTVSRSLGCPFAFAEMVSARALAHGNRKTLRMLRTSPADRPLGIQLLGEDPECLRRALDALDGRIYDLLDLNAACPVKKVTRRGGGALLMKDPLRLRDLLSILVGWARVPVTVKIRAGWGGGFPPARDIALHAQDAGIAALCIHGRSREQGYRGQPDYSVIRVVKEALSIPVIASGDALSPPLVRKLIDDTGCDGVLIARGALGNPWIFRELGGLFGPGAPPPRPDPAEIARVMRAHLDLCRAHYGDAAAAAVFRKHFAWYVKGFAGVKALTERAFAAATPGEMARVIADFGVARGVIFTGRAGY